MNLTDKYNFRMPEGLDLYNEADQNKNWHEIEKILSEASIGSTSTIEKLENGDIKVTYVDNTYTIYHTIGSDGTISREEYDSNGVLVSSKIEDAMSTIMGVNMRINDVIKDVLEKYNELMGILWSSGVKQDGKTILTEVPQDWEHRNNVVIKANYPNGDYGIFSVDANGNTSEIRYNSSGEQISSNTNVDFASNLILTNVRIAQLEKTVSNLQDKLKSESETGYFHDKTLFNGTKVTDNGRPVIRAKANALSVTPIVSFSHTIDGGMYAFSLRCRSTLSFNAALIHVIIMDGQSKIADAIINANNFKNNNKYYTFSFIFNTISHFNSSLTISLEILNTGGPSPDVFFDYFNLKRITTGIGSCPNTISI